MEILYIYPSIINFHLIIRISKKLQGLYAMIDFSSEYTIKFHFTLNFNFTKQLVTSIFH